MLPFGVVVVVNAEDAVEVLIMMKVMYKYFFVVAK